MKTAGRVVITVILACVLAPIIGTVLLTAFEGGLSVEFFVPQPGAIPLWLFAPVFVAPFTVLSATIFSVVSPFLGRALHHPGVRLPCFAVLGLLGSTPYPAFLTLVSSLSTFDAIPYGVTAKDQFVFMVEHWLSAGLAGIIVGLILSFVWQFRHDGNANGLVRTGDPRTARQPAQPCRSPQ